MRIAGYVVKVTIGWVVCEYTDGSIQKISRLQPAVKASEVILD